MEPGALEIGSSLVLAVHCCAAIWLDFRYRRLPNLLCISTFCFGIISGLLLHDLPWVGMSALHAVLALAVGAMLFAVKMIGAGDAKFYAAAAAWVPLAQALSLLLFVSLAGLLLLVIWFPNRRRIAAMAPDPAMALEFRKVPYGIAIALGACMTVVLSSDVWSGAL